MGDTGLLRRGVDEPLGVGAFDGVPSERGARDGLAGGRPLEILELEEGVPEECPMGVVGHGLVGHRLQAEVFLGSRREEVSPTHPPTRPGALGEGLRGPTFGW